MDTHISRSLPIISEENFKLKNFSKKRIEKSEEIIETVEEIKILRILYKNIRWFIFISGAYFQIFFRT